MNDDKNSLRHSQLIRLGLNRNALVQITSQVLRELSAGEDYICAWCGKPAKVKNKPFLQNIDEDVCPECAGAHARSHMHPEPLVPDAEMWRKNLTMETGEYPRYEVK